MMDSPIDVTIVAYSLILMTHWYFKRDWYLPFGIVVVVYFYSLMAIHVTHVCVSSCVMYVNLICLWYFSNMYALYHLICNQCHVCVPTVTWRAHYRRLLTRDGVAAASRHDVLAACLVIDVYVCWLFKPGGVLAIVYCVCDVCVVVVLMTFVTSDGVVFNVVHVFDAIGMLYVLSSICILFKLLFLMLAYSTSVVVCICVCLCI